MKKTYFLISIFILSICFFSCAIKQPNSKLILEKCECTLDSASVDSVSFEQQELDYFYSLMAYAVVHKDWQVNALEGRGYNIGSVLVDSDKYVVDWARNSVNIKMNATQHGEVRVMQSYLDSVQTYSLKGFSIYTTLEPCAMCSGMMKLTSINRTVYGQTDPDYGKALQRLQLKSDSCCSGGYSPYPRPVISDKSADPISAEIDSAYANYKGKYLVDFLATSEAEKLFRKASSMFQLYKKAKYAENQKYIDSAHELYNLVDGSIK
ncbi:nucleoside deaminase [Neotamlana sedimentorum]|uniref:nucleoside deaminase n=1 Tax=Neotamlana sedimentorum TaxID=1435349 RepID=UPI00069B5422|nr:deaminase [Tamlana sedimentorum]